jgi:hypothetical protein
MIQSTRLHVVFATVILYFNDCFQDGISFLQNDRVIRSTTSYSRKMLSDAYQDGDLVAVKHPTKGSNHRLCAVCGKHGSVIPLCIREDNVETDLFADPREFTELFWQKDVTDTDVTASFGEGFYGQRPVPSLGGGPGYGADADELWSVSFDTLGEIRSNGVDMPVLDVGIAHGEKARGGFF